MINLFLLAKKMEDFTIDSIINLYGIHYCITQGLLFIRDLPEYNWIFRKTGQGGLHLVYNTRNSGKKDGLFWVIKYNVLEPIIKKRWKKIIGSFIYVKDESRCYFLYDRLIWNIFARNIEYDEYINFIKSKNFLTYIKIMEEISDKQKSSKDKHSVIRNIVSLTTSNKDKLDKVNLLNSQLKDEVNKQYAVIEEYKNELLLSTDKANDLFYKLEEKNKEILSYQSEMKIMQSEYESVKEEYDQLVSELEYGYQKIQSDTSFVMFKVTHVKDKIVHFLPESEKYQLDDTTFQIPADRVYNIEIRGGKGNSNFIIKINSEKMVNNSQRIFKGPLNIGDQFQIEYNGNNEKNIDKYYLEISY